MEPGVAPFSNLLGRLAYFNVDFEITSLLKQKKKNHFESGRLMTGNQDGIEDNPLLPYPITASSRRIQVGRGLYASNWLG